MKISINRGLVELLQHEQAYAKMNAVDIIPSFPYYHLYS